MKRTHIPITRQLSEQAAEKELMRLRQIKALEGAAGMEG
jgi:hypothetical protein